MVGAALTGVSPVSMASADPALRLPDSVDFGTTALAHPVTRAVQVQVTGATAVTFGATWTQTATETAGLGGEFRVTEDSCTGRTLTTGETCSVTLRFKPYAVGTRVGTLLVRDGADNTIGTVPLTAVATENAEGTYYSTAPARLLDTRRTGTRAPLGAGSTTTIQVGGRAGVPASGVSAVVVNVTAVATTSAGYFTAYPSGKPRPTASTVNFPKEWTGAVMATVPVGADGALELYNYGGPAHAVVDVLGWYAADSSVLAANGVGTMMYRFEPSERMFDSRRQGGALHGGEAVELGVDWGADADNAAVRSWVLNVTAVGATRPGVLTAWSGQGNRPVTSTLNYEPGVIAPNMAVVPSGHDAGGTSFRLDNVSSGSVHVVVDVMGVMLAGQDQGLRFVRLDTPTRFVDTRTGLGLTGPFGSRSTRTVSTGAVAPSAPVARDAIDQVVTITTGVTPADRTYLSMWADGGERSVASVLNVEQGAVRSAAAYLPVDVHGRAVVYNDAGPMHLTMDAVGVFYDYDLVNGGPDEWSSTPEALSETQRSSTAWPGAKALPGGVTVTRR